MTNKLIGNRIKAVIIPLSNFFYDFEKYDGKSKADRFTERHKWIDRFLERIENNYTLFIILVIGILIFYFIPYILMKLIFNNREKAKEKINYKLEHLGDSFFEPTYGTTNAKDVFESIRARGFDIFIYYTSEMIPKNLKKKKIFYERLDYLRASFPYFHIFEANDKYDVKTMVEIFNIDIPESHFISHQKIDLSDYALLEETTLEQIIKF